MTQPERIPPSPVPEPVGPFVAKDRPAYLRELARRLREHVRLATVGSRAKQEIGYAADILNAMADLLEEEDNAT